MNRIWLPPIDLCCEKATFEFEVFIDFEVHLRIKCEEHGNHFIKSPFRTSSYDAEFYPSKNLFKLIWKHLNDRQKAIFNERIKERYKNLPINHKGEQITI